MPSIDTYTANVRLLAGDVDTAIDVYEYLALASETAERTLSVPGEIEDYLRGRADAVDLPDALVRVLGALPYGIGFAIQQLNRVSNTVGNSIDRQADVFEALALTWDPAHDAADALNTFLEQLAPAAILIETAIDNRIEEAERLEAFMAGQSVPADTELGRRMDAYAGPAGDWQETRDALLAPLRAIGDAINEAISAIDAVLPDLPSIREVMNRALTVFTSAANIAGDIYDALDIDIHIWPLPTWNLIDAIEAISDFVGVVQDTIEDIVLGILSGLGFNLNIFGGVADAMMEILDPLFSVFATIGDAVSSMISAVVDAVVDAADWMEQVLLDLGAAVGLETLFAHDIAIEDLDGAQALGTPGEDGIFGNIGNDSLYGAAGDDFLFGAAGDDRLVGQTGSDEMFAGEGRDTIFGGPGHDFADGGPGIDTAILLSSREEIQVTEDGNWLLLSSPEGQDRYGRVEVFILGGETYTAAELRATADARIVRGGDGNDNLTGTPGDDAFFGGAGNDTMNGGAGGDAYDGGPGRDVVTFVDAARSVRVDLQNDRFLYGDAVGDTYRNIEVFVTGNTVDQLRGDASGNVFYTGGLSDRLYGRAGNDVMFGQDGADAFFGGLGADTMTGGGDDRRDRFIYFNMVESGVGAGNRDVVTDFTPGEDRIEISRFDADLTRGFRQEFTFVGDAPLTGAGQLGYRHEGGNTIVQADVTGDAVPDFEIQLTGVMDLEASDFLL